MIARIGVVKVESLNVVPGGCKITVTIPETHHYNWRREGAPPDRPEWTLRVTEAEALQWLPLVGKVVECTLVGAGEASNASAAQRPPDSSVAVAETPEEEH